MATIKNTFLVVCAVIIFEHIPVIYQGMHPTVPYQQIIPAAVNLIL